MYKLKKNLKQKLCIKMSKYLIIIVLLVSELNSSHSNDLCFILIQNVNEIIHQMLIIKLNLKNYVMENMITNVIRIY